MERVTRPFIVPFVVTKGEANTDAKRLCRSRLAGGTIVLAIAVALIELAASSSLALDPLRGPLSVDPSQIPGASISIETSAAIGADGSALFGWITKGEPGGAGFGVVWASDAQGNATGNVTLVTPQPLGDQTQIHVCLGDGGNGRALLLEQRLNVQRVIVASVSLPGPIVSVSPAAALEFEAVDSLALGCDASGRAHFAVMAWESARWHLLYVEEGAAGWYPPVDLLNGSSLYSGYLLSNKATNSGDPFTFLFRHQADSVATPQLSVWQCASVSCQEQSSVPFYPWATAFALDGRNGTLLDWDSGQAYLSQWNEAGGTLTARALVGTASAGSVLAADIVSMNLTSVFVVVARAKAPFPSNLTVESHVIDRSNLSSSSDAIVEVVWASSTPSASALSGAALGSGAVVIWTSSAGENFMGIDWFDPESGFDTLAHRPNPLGVHVSAKDAVVLAQDSNGKLVSAWIDAGQASVLVSIAVAGAPPVKVAEVQACKPPTACSGLEVVAGQSGVVVFWSSWNASSPGTARTLWAWQVPTDGQSTPSPFPLASSAYAGATKPPSASSPVGGYSFVVWFGEDAIGTGLRVFQLSLAAPGSSPPFLSQSTPNPVVAFSTEAPAAGGALLLVWTENNGTRPAAPFEVLWAAWNLTGSPAPLAAPASLLTSTAQNQAQYEAARRGGAVALGMLVAYGADRWITLVNWSLDLMAASAGPLPCGPERAPSGVAPFIDAISAQGSQEGFSIAWLQSEGGGLGGENLGFARMDEASGEWRCYGEQLAGGITDWAASPSVTAAARTFVGLLKADASSGGWSKAVAYFPNTPPPAPKAYLPANGSLFSSAPDSWAWQAGADLDGDPVAFTVEWYPCGTPAASASLTTNVPEATLAPYLKEGPYCWRVGANDGFGAVWGPWATFTLAPGGPTAGLTFPGVVEEGQVFEASASSSSGAAPPLEFDFDLDGDGTFEIMGSSPSRNISFANEGVFDIGLRVTDALGRSSTDRGSVVVVNAPPRLTVGGDRSAQVGVSSTWSCTVADPGPNDVITVWWLVDNGAALEGCAVDYLPGKAGVFKVSVLAIDDGGAVARASFQLIVADRPLIVSVTGPASLDAGFVGRFDAVAPTLNGSELASVVWRVNGSTKGTGPALNWSFAEPGTYEVRASAARGDGMQASGALLVTVGRALPHLSVVRLPDRGGVVVLGFAVTGTDRSPDFVSVRVRQPGAGDFALLMEVPGALAGEFEIPYSSAGDHFSLFAEAEWTGGHLTVRSNEIEVTREVAPGTQLGNTEGLLLIVVLVLIAAVATYVAMRRRAAAP